MIELYRKLLGLLDRGEKRQFALLVVMIIAMGLLDVIGVAAVLPFLSVLADPTYIHENRILSWAYDTTGAPDDRTFLMWVGVGVFLVVVVGLAFKAVTQFVLIRFSTMRNYSISNRLFRGYIAKDYAWFLHRHSADLGKSILSEVDQVIHTCMIPGLELLAHASVAIALAALLLALEPLVMLLAVMLFAGTYVLIYGAVRGTLARVGEKRVDANAERYKLANEAFSGIKEVKLMSLEHSYARRYGISAEMFARTQSFAFSIGQIPRYVLEAIAFGGMLGFVIYLLGHGSEGLDDAVPTLGLFAFAGIRLFPALQQVYRDFTQLRFGKSALENLHEQIVEARGDLGPQVDTPALPLKQLLELREIHFRFPEAPRPALQGVDMQIHANSMVGIVGGSGAGKTTTIDVILGLLRPDSGRLLVDGVEVTEANRIAWQKSVGYVPQQIFLLDDTVAANIAFGEDPQNIDMARVERAARAAELHDFVTREMAEGYQTMVGERGIRLSGGQRQRIGIARALYRDPDVLVFDEATSALDNLTERAVMEALRNIAGTKTIIVVAHRLTTVMDCSNIFFMGNGRVLEQGTYAELLEKSPEFRELALRGGRNG